MGQESTNDSQFSSKMIFTVPIDLADRLKRMEKEAFPGV